MDRYDRPARRSLLAAVVRLALGLLIALAAAALGACGRAPDLPPGYAIVYGVSDYTSISDLGQPAADADAMAAMLEEAGYTIVSGGPRTDAEATWANVQADFAEAAASAPRDSRFVFYFAGHGFGDGMEYQYDTPPFSQAWADHITGEAAGEEPTGAGSYPEYLFLHSADPFNDVPLALEESISDDELASLVRSVPSRQRVVIIDACHSGGFAGSGTTVDTVPRAYDGYEDGAQLVDALNAMTLYLDYGADPVDLDEQDAVVITAAGEQDFSYEGSYWGFPNGVFTHFFLEAREAADHDYDGYVSTTEAYAHAVSAIRAVANDDLVDQEKFIPRVTGGAVDFILFPARTR